MAGSIVVTNPKKRKRKKTSKKRKARKNPSSKKRRRRRNPAKGFIGRWLNGLTHDGGLAVANLGGRYVGETAGALGDHFLGETVGSFAGTAGQVLIHLGMFKFAPKRAGWNQARIGLLSQAIHEVLTDQAGVDVPGMILDVVPFGKEEAPKEEGTEGLGLVSDDALDTKLAGFGRVTSYSNPYLAAYN